MPEKVRRGFDPSDARWFSAGEVSRLRQAQRDIVWLLDRGYGMEQSVNFVGNRFQFSTRQRVALTRASCPTAVRYARLGREQPVPPYGCVLAVDGFNLVITLETVLSGSTVLRCMDGTLRDLAGVRGSYRLIACTLPAVRLAVEAMADWPVGRLIWVLDAPVSNSGRLAGCIREVSAGSPFPVEVELSTHADARLAAADFVVTTDSVILDHCPGWVNLAPRLAAGRPDFEPVDLSL